jgi:MFS family permease
MRGAVVSDQDAATRTPRAAFRLLIDPAFGALFWGKLMTSSGTWMHGIVAAIVIYQLTASALMVGLVGVAQFGPQIILSPLSGKWADRGNPIRQMLVGRVMCAIGSGSAAVWTAASHGLSGAVAAVPLLAGTVLVGLGFVIGGPAMQSVVPKLLRPGELATAMTLNTIPLTVARIAGPATGAFLYSQLGAPLAFAIGGCGHVIFIVLLLVVHFPPLQESRPGVDYRVLTGLRYVWQDRPLLLLLLAIGVVGFGSDPSITLAPSVAAELGGGTGLVGLLSTAFGSGAAVGLVVLGLMRSRISSAATASTALWLLAAGLAMVGVGRWAALALSGFALAGCGFSWGLTGLSTMVQSRAPDELRGRIMALWSVGFAGARPVSGAVLGGTADLFSVRAAFIAAVVLTVIMALLCRPRLLSRPGPVPLLQ